MKKFLLNTIEEAIKDVEREPTNPKSYLKAGKIVEKFEDYESAIRYYQTAIELDKKFIAAYINLSNLYYKKERNHLKAISILKKGISENPRNEKLILSLAKLYYRRQDYEKAIKELEKIKSYDAKYYMTLCFIALKRYIEAKKILEKLIEDFPHKTKPYHKIIEIHLMHTAEKEEAKKYMKEYIKRFKDKHTIEYQKQLGRLEKDA
jgi:tetratricopeptide (TPR) repeat protein